MDEVPVRRDVPGAATGTASWRSRIAVAIARRRAGLAVALARRRVPAGFALGALTLWLARPTPRSLQAGAVLAVTGEAIRIWAAGHLEKGREVTASGPYRLTRHPLYLGSTIMGVGLAVASASLAVTALVLGYLVLMLTAAIRTEESHLTEKFGGEYPAYREGRARTAPRTFSLARAMRNREYRAVAGLAAVLALLWWKARNGG